MEEKFDEIDESKSLFIKKNPHLYSSNSYFFLNKNRIYDKNQYKR